MEKTKPKIIFTSILNSMNKYMKKANVDKTNIETFLKFYYSKDMTNYSKEVSGTILDTTNPKSSEYKKPIRFLTAEEIKVVKSSLKLGEVMDKGKINKNKKIQDYLNRKNRQI
tara:strand:+ start:766 stop:1104 length:339 start_codon:yes stop_codon:yes gene_type:complete